MVSKNPVLNDPKLESPFGEVNGCGNIFESFSPRGFAARSRLQDPELIVIAQGNPLVGTILGTLREPRNRPNLRQQ